MQKLIFQSAWDKTIAEQDREKIKQAFLNVRLIADKDIQFTSLWEAKNHRGELLVAVLIHNTSEQDFSFCDQIIKYKINGKIFAEHTFSPPIIVGKQRPACHGHLFFLLIVLIALKGSRTGNCILVEAFR